MQITRRRSTPSDSQHPTTVVMRDLVGLAAKVLQDQTAQARATGHNGSHREIPERPRKMRHVLRLNDFVRDSEKTAPWLRSKQGYCRVLQKNELQEPSAHRHELLDATKASLQTREYQTWFREMPRRGYAVRDVAKPYITIPRGHTPRTPTHSDSKSGHP